MSRYCVYSAVFGGYDIVAPSPSVESRNGPPYFLVSDSPQQTEGWIQVPIDNFLEESPELSNRRFKTFPPEAAKRFPYFCYVDGNVKVQEPLDDFFEEFLHSGADLAFFQHSDRKNLRQELEACEKQGKINGALGRAQIESYEREGFRQQVPLLEGSLFFRKNNPKTDEMMSIWSREIQNWRTRDQLSLPYAIWKSGVNLHIFPGTPRRMYSRFIYTAHGGRTFLNFLLRGIAIRLGRQPLLLENAARVWRRLRNSSSLLGDGN